MTQFTDLGLNAQLLRALAAEGYDTPTPIQAQAIPALMEGRDLLGIAQTGTGKTAAFALPILHRLAADAKPAPKRGCRALILSPTRELAVQINESFRTYGKFLKLTSTVVVGGMSMERQVKALMHGVDVLVATPGRLLDHAGGRSLNLGATEIIVLDEADQMLDMGFVVPVRKIVAMLPKQRQSLFFSATMPREIGALAADFLSDPVRVEVTPVATTAQRVEQHVIHVEGAQKRHLLAKMLTQDPGISRALVFARTKHGANKLAEHLVASGFGADAIHGNKSQSQRQNALNAFKAGRARVLVATDIAARGIDVDNVTHVINFDLPNLPESYVHRIGRTGRASASGVAISFCAPDERAFLRSIEKLTRKSIPVTSQFGSFAAAAAPEEPARVDQPRGGQSRGGQSRDGQRPAQGNGQRRDGKPFGDRPDQGQRRDGKPFGERSESGQRRDGKPFGERPAQGQRRDGKPFGERSDQPRAAKPYRGDPPRADHRPSDARLSDARPAEAKRGESRGADPKRGGDSRPRQDGNRGEPKRTGDAKRAGGDRIWSNQADSAPRRPARARG